MAKYITFRLINTLCLIAFLTLAGCKPKIEGHTVNLEPNDPRPILSIQVADANEAALLVQELKLDVVEMKGLTLFFFEDAEVLPRLQELGYELKQQNSYEVFRRVVRIDRSIPEAELVKNGVRVINREKQYLIVEATIGQLRALTRKNAQIVAISGDEPRPRQIRIVVDSMKDVAKIGAMEVDIYNAKPERKDSIDYAQNSVDRVKIIIHGGAFDYQIDQLEKQGYSIEILPEPTSTNTRRKL